MSNKLALNFFWLLVLGGALNYYLTYSPVTAESRRQLTEAHAQYMKGETAETLGERQTTFNQALALYTDIEKQYHPTFSDGRLYYNIGNSYFQIGEYPRAILYYYRAQALMPRSPKVTHNLEVALAKLGFDAEAKTSAFDTIFFFDRIYSLPERLQLFFIFAFVSLILGSLYVWNTNKRLKLAAIGAALLATAMFCSVGYSHYLAPTEGVIVRATALYRDAGLQYAKVLEEPILSGIKVEILDTAQEGQWLKITTPKGQLGYIPQESIRMI